MYSELHKRLAELAYAKSESFCYHDQIVCPDSVCPKCGSDDLMRLVPSVGHDWGLHWIVEYILETELSPADVEDAFEQSVRACYPEETKVGWMSFDTVTLMKKNDPVGWSVALDEYESQEESDENILSFNNGSTYYSTCDVENLLERAGF